MCYALLVVYFVQMGRNGPIKIGQSRDDRTLRRRLEALSTSLPYAPRLRGVVPGVGRDYEQALHRRFARHRLRGEWFRPMPEVLEAANEVARGAIPHDPARRDLERAELLWRQACGTVGADA